MAPKKPPPPKPAPLKKPGTALISWSTALTTAAQKQAKAEKPLGGVASVSLRGGIVSVDGDAVKGNKLSVIVLAAIHENTYYETRYDPDHKTAPTCYAFGDPESDDPEDSMAPHANAEVPQAKRCADCDFNVMGSADTGKGKACKNIRRLIVVPADCIESAEKMAEAELRVVKLPVTSVKNWAKYANSIIEDLTLPTWGVVTVLSAVPDAKTQFKATFELEEKIEFNDKIWPLFSAKLEEAKKTALQAYPKQSDLDERASEKPLHPVGKASKMMNRGKAPAKKAKY